MPLSALLRRHRRSETDLRRHSTVDPTEYARHSEHVPRTRPSTDFLSPYPTTYPSAASSQSSNQRDPLPSDNSTRPSYESGLRPTTPTNGPPHRHHRFSLLRSRNASDSQLGARARAQAAQGRERQIPPAIITTAPTMEAFERQPKQKQKLKLPSGPKARSHTNLASQPSEYSAESVGKSRNGSAGGPVSGNGSLRASRVTFDQPDRPSSLAVYNAPMHPPSYDESHASLPIPNPRGSESSRSDGSSGEHVAYATTTTTHTVSTTTTFFRLPRRKKARPSLFPLPAKTGLPESGSGSPATPRASSNVSRECAKISGSNSLSMAENSPGLKGKAGFGIPPLASPTRPPLATSSAGFAAPGSTLLRQDSTTSTMSARSSPSSLIPPTRLGRRGRSSTIGSLKDTPDDAAVPTPPLPSSRTSTSTVGRNSFGGLFNITHRLRQNSEPSYPHHTSPGPGTPVSNNSKSNSLHLIREPVVIPERAEDDTPAKYLARLQQAVSRGVVASILSKAADQFAQAVLKSYMRSFKFFGDPMDMATRKLLMEVELPKETQQIDRVVQAFADRYHECNPGIYASPDQAYFIAFSLIILHTDVFNKNNKHKMQRQDYIKNTSGEGISDDILECFYDNISYTPFIHVEDDVDINGEKIVPHKSRKGLFTRGSADAIKRPSKEPVDPYTLIIDSKLDALRPSLKDVMNLDDPYCYLGTADSLDLANLHKTFFKSAVLQIVSARSRPEAFMSPTTISNPEEAHPGVVDIKVTKVGLLWRKEAKKKKGRSPWQEWGAVLTGSQLYFFRNTTWIKNLIHQYDAHHKHGHAGAPVTFKPPLENFKPDALMSTDDAVALLDSSYRKHKNAFVFVRHGGFEETFLADSDQEMNDWLAKLNYAAAFRTAGVRMRGLVGGNYEGQRTRGIRRMDAGNSAQSVQTPTGEVSILSGKIDAQLAQQILAARRQIMSQKISEAEEKLSLAQKQLDDQLRNARHLQILAPIQAKTREQVILAAGRMAAKLKWVRVEMWKLRCHKDILLMDLEDEKRSTIDKQLRQQAIAAPGLSRLPSPDSQKEGIARLDSRTSRSRSPQRSLHTPTEVRPPRSASSMKEHDFGMEELFHAPSHLSRQSSYRKNQTSWELPPLAFDTSPIHRGSISGTNPTSPASSSLTNPQSRSSGIGSDGQPNFTDVIGGETPLVCAEDSETDVLNGAGLVIVDSPSLGPRNTEVLSEDDIQKGKTKKGSDAEATEKGKSRRSLRGTLRDAHTPSHHRSRRGKDSGSSGITAEDGGIGLESEGLARGTGSFTVHGKKASVITFGSEWQNVSPEERIRLRKQSHTDEAKLPTHAAADSEGESTFSPPLASVRRESAASQSTATVRSFQRWESREASGDADTESLVALSISDGRRTPLRTIQDEGEEGRLPSSHGKEKKMESNEERSGERARLKDGVPQLQPLSQVVST